MAKALLVVILAMVASPAAAQTCTAVTPVRLATSLAGIRAFPRPLTTQQASELATLLPVLRREPPRAAAGLRSWVAKSGFTARDRCPLVYALIRSAATQGVAGTAASTGAADAIVARIQALTAALAGLQADLRGLQAQLQAETINLKALMGARPVAPAAPATPEASAAYARAVSDWQSKVDAQQAKIASLQEAIAHKQAEIDARQKELDALLNPLLPGTVEQAVAASAS